MSLKFRRFLYIFFIIAFLVITPLVSLYAAGYKVASNFSLQKTGALIVDTAPKDAKIFLNGKPQQLFFEKFFSAQDSFIRTPAKIKNLLPGDYEVRLELENFWPWQKKLAVYPGQATFAEDIYLFKRELPLLLERGEFFRVAYSPDRSYAALIGRESAAALNLNDEKIKIFPIPATSNNVFRASSTIPVWSPRGRKAIIGRALFDLEAWDNPAVFDFALSDQAENFKWGQDDSHIFYQIGPKLYRHSLDDGSTVNVTFKDDILDYSARGNYLYLIGQSAQSLSLTVINSDDFENIRKINLPVSTYSFINPEAKLVNLYDTTHRLLYLIDPLSEVRPLREIINNVTLANWVDDDRLLYANDFEIWLFDLKDNNKTLLTRISREIAGLFWHPSDNYVIFTTDKSIHTIELDDREKRNITELLSLEEIKWPELSAQGDDLYFYAKIGNQSGLYKLAIQ